MTLNILFSHRLSMHPLRDSYISLQYQLLQSILVLFILNSLLFAWYQYAATSSFLYHICKKNSGIKVEKRRKYCSLTRTSYLQKNTPSLIRNTDFDLGATSKRLESQDLISTETLLNWSLFNTSLFDCLSIFQAVNLDQNLYPNPRYISLYAKWFFSSLVFVRPLLSFQDKFTLCTIDQTL